MKLSAWVINVIGLAVALIALSYALFHTKLPNDAEAKMYRQRTEELEAQAALQSKAEKRVSEAVALVNSAASQWKRVVATRTPATDVNAGGIDLDVNGWQLSVDTQKFAKNVQRAINKQVVRGGVRVTQAPTAPRPDVNSPVNGLLASYYNYPAFPYPVLILDLGQVTVEGTYKQIMDNVRSYATMPRYLAMADGLSLTGTGDKLTGTYRIQVVGFIRGKKIYPNVPEGAAAAAPGGGAGGPGRPGATGPGRGGPSFSAGGPGGGGPGARGPVGASNAGGG